MTPEQFVYWLQGKLEGRHIGTLGKEELKIIQDHLNTVFHKVTPPYPPTPTYIHPLDRQGTNIPPSFPPGTVIC